MLFRIETLDDTGTSLGNCGARTGFNRALGRLAHERAPLVCVRRSRRYARGKGKQTRRILESNEIFDANGHSRTDPAAGI